MKTTVMFMVLMAASTVSEARLCNGAAPIGCRVRYQWWGENTAVMADCQCPQSFETWYVSFFLGHEEPSLYEWFLIQNDYTNLVAG